MRGRAAVDVDGEISLCDATQLAVVMDVFTVR